MPEFQSKKKKTFVVTIPEYQINKQNFAKSKMFHLETIKEPLKTTLNLGGRSGGGGQEGFSYFFLLVFARIVAN